MRFALILDYDGCTANCFTTQWRVKKYKNHDAHKQTFLFYSAVIDLFKIARSEGVINVAIPKLLKQNTAASQHLIKQLTKMKGTTGGIDRAIAKLRKQDTAAKNNLIALLTTLKNDCVTKLTNIIEYMAQGWTPKPVSDLYTELIEHINRLPQYLFIAEILYAGFNIKQDSIIILNGSARQSKGLDEFSGLHHNNGLISEQLEIITSHIRAIFNEKLGMEDTENKIQWSPTTSLDTTDTPEPTALAIKYSMDVIEASKLGLWAEQIHFAKRQGCQQSLIFDDRLIPKAWAEFPTGTHHIEEAFLEICQKSHSLPNETKVSLVLFDHVYLVDDAYEGVETALGDHYCGLNVGVVGEVIGTGADRPRGYFRKVLTSKSFDLAKEEFTKLLSSGDELAYTGGNEPQNSKRPATLIPKIFLAATNGTGAEPPRKTQRLG